LTTSYFDFVTIQFYNNYCGLQAFGTDNFNFAQWSTQVKSSFNPNMRLFLGAPASPTAAGSGYVSQQQLLTVYKSLLQYNNFNGLMFWSTMQDLQNNNYVAGVKAGLVTAGAGAAAGAAESSETSKVASTSSVGSISPRPQCANSGAICSAGILCCNSGCCSKWGYCGTTEDHCGSGCQSGSCSGAAVIVTTV